MSTSGTWRELARTGRLGQFTILCLGVWLHAADSFLAATTMPSAVQQIGGVAFINWTIALYQLGGIVSGACSALAARRFGMRDVILAAAGSYALGCVASALAPDIGVMLAGRVLQGVGGGAMVAITYVATQSMFEERFWTRLMAVVSAIWGASALCGPVIGGLFATAGLWRGAFWAFGGQAVLLAATAAIFLRGLPRTSSGPRRIPLRPLAMLCAATLAIAMAGVAPGDLLAAGLGVLGLALLWLAARLDAGAATRLMPRELLRLRHPVGAGLLMIVALAVGSSSFTSYGPLLLEVLYRATPLVAGSVVAAGSVTWTVATLLTANLSDSWDRVLIRGGSVMVLLACAGFAAFVPRGPEAAIVACVLLQGAGFGMAWPFMVRRIVISAPQGERDIAASATSTMQRIGYAVGASACGIAANMAGLREGATVPAAHAAAFWVFAAFVPVLALGCAAAMLLTAGASLPLARAERPVLGAGEG
jgi:MFS family permease